MDVPPAKATTAVYFSKSDGLTGVSQRSYELKRLPDGTTRFAVYFTMPVGVGQPAFAEIETMVPPEKWTHLAATYSRTTGLAIYKNGVLAATSTNYDGSASFVGLTLRQTTLPLLLCGDPTYPTAGAKGFADEMRVWSVARNADEISADLHRKLSGSEPGLAGYWNFDNGAAADATGHGHNGSLSGSATIADMTGEDVIHAACVPHRATAIASVVKGFVVGATLTDLGCGYLGAGAANQLL